VLESISLEINDNLIYDLQAFLADLYAIGADACSGLKELRLVAHEE
jgi:hypothetical protein